MRVNLQKFFTSLQSFAKTNFVIGLINRPRRGEVDIKNNANGRKHLCKKNFRTRGNSFSWMRHIIGVGIATAIFALNFVMGVNRSLANDPDAISDALVEKALAMGASRSKTWKFLLHLRDNGRSVVTDQKFFLSKDGGNNPEAELRETIRAFFETGDLGNGHAICRFPARFNYVVKLLGLDEDKKIFPEAKCGELADYMKKISPETVSLSVASENITSPMSMLGHIFVKISGHDSNGRLTEHALTYYAQFASSSPSLRFYISALAGGASGTYSLTPYRSKLGEYNDGEDRNVWDYELNFTKVQAWELALHIWELRGINIRYSFAAHNCGTASMYLLAIADENFYDLGQRVAVTPLDIVKTARSLDLIRNISLSQTDSHKIKSLQRNFTAKEKKAIKKFVEIGDYEALTSDADRTQKNNRLFMADAVAGKMFLSKKISPEKYWKVEKIISDNFDGEEATTLKRTEKIQLNNPFSTGLSVKYGKYKNGHSALFSFYPVYRDINDDNSQMHNDFTLQLGRIDVRAGDEGANIERFDAIKLKSLTPSDLLLPAWSFLLNISLKTDGDPDSNSRKLNPLFDVGFGKTYSIFSDHARPYVMLGSEYFGEFYGTLEIGVILNFTKRDKTVVEYVHKLGKHGRRGCDSYNLNINQNFYINDRLSLNLEYENFGHRHSNFLGGIKVYF
ncbi:MAG: DUF4105 domain-containing protein [Rickettsiales bacterium]|jgi:hypothetical protein|nr:DUF4105 domain-containing protein [Rickettsiales bacterium]